MRSKMPAVIAVGVFTVVAYQGARLRGTQGRSPTATTPDSTTIRRGDAATVEVGIGRERPSGPRSIAASRPVGIGVKKER